MFHFKHKYLIVKKLYYSTYKNDYYYIDTFNVEVCSKCGKVEIKKADNNCYGWHNDYERNLSAIKEDSLYEEYKKFIDRIYTKEDILDGIKNNKNINSQEKIRNVIDAIKINK